MQQPNRDDEGREASTNDEIEALRARFSTIDDIDARTTEMFERITSVLRDSSEERAQASIEIATGLRRLEENLAADRRRQIEMMQALHADAESARLRIEEVLQAVAALGAQVTGLQARVSPLDEPDDSKLQPVAPPVSPLGAVQSWTVMFDEVPTASVALTLQHHLESLPSVLSVASVAFADGHLEFALRSRGALAGSNIAAWDGGILEILDEAPFAIRARLVSADEHATQAHGAPS
jgi:hypothetical protein